MGMVRRVRDAARRGTGTARGGEARGAGHRAEHVGAARPAGLAGVPCAASPRAIGVSVICPRGPGAAGAPGARGRADPHATDPPPGTTGVAGYVVEFAYCWLRTAAAVVPRAAPRRLRRHPGLQPARHLLRCWRCCTGRSAKRFVFDQHDLCPEVYASRFGDAPAGCAARAPGCSSGPPTATADHVIATNESYRAIAMRRGGVGAEHVTVVRSGPDPDADAAGSPDPELRDGREHLCCWLGIMGPQDGVDLLLRVDRRGGPRARPRRTAVRAPRVRRLPGRPAAR